MVMIPVCCETGLLVCRPQQDSNIMCVHCLRPLSGEDVLLVCSALTGQTNACVSIWSCFRIAVKRSGACVLCPN
jgi:hypothetical protein